MKITYIADSIIPSQTANSVHVMKMCQALSLNGHNVVLLVPNKIDKNIKVSDVYDFYGVEKCFKIIKLPFPKIVGGIFIFSLLSILRAKRKKADLVYTRFLYSCFLGLLMKFPTIFEIHSPSFVTKIDNFLFRFIAKNKSKKIVVISRALRDHLAKKYKIDSAKIAVAPDGADPVPSELKPVEIKNDDKLRIGYVGHLYKGRGIDIIAEMARKCPWAEFHIIGGLPEDLNYWKKELVKQKNIIFYGYVPHRKVYEYMLAFDALIAPYQEKVSVLGGGNTSEWMSPLKIFEYMAAGKAILSSDLPVLKEILTHGKNALLAPPADVDKWITNLEQIKTNVSLRKSLGEIAKREFEEKYTWKSRAEFILEELG